MTDELPEDVIEFDETVVVALASLVTGAVPRPEVRQRLLASLAEPQRVPLGFSFRFAADADWQPCPVPGIRMKVLAVNHVAGYATLLLDVAPRTKFPAHHHAGAEECYVLSGSVYTCDRRMTAGDFLHADANTDHGELWSEEGCRVLLIVPPDDSLLSPPR